MSTVITAAQHGSSRHRRVLAAVLAALVVVTAQPAPPPVRAAEPTSQTITFDLPDTAPTGSTLALTPTSNSGLTVSLLSDTPAVCSIDAATLTLTFTAAGTCTVSASQSGTDDVAPAPTLQSSTTVEPVAAEPAAQTITFTLPASAVVGATVVLGGTADSGLPVAYIEDSPTTCTVADGTLTALAAGSCHVTAVQPGDDTFAPAEDVPAAMTVEPAPVDPAPQTISFVLPSSTLVGSVTALAGSATSGLPVSYVSNTLLVCAVSGTTVTGIAPGTCTVTASQGGGEAYEPAPTVAASMTVEAVPQGVNLGKYAVDGPVRAVTIEPGSGRTFLGGDFTQIGRRTGPIAVVEPPDDGTGGLLPASPEVLGAVGAVIADDRPNNPGFFIAGELIAVNGTAVAQTPVIRMRLDATATRWVVDSSWKVQDPDGQCLGLGRHGAWIGTSSTLIAGGNTYDHNKSGLWFINRASGVCTVSLPGVMTPLPMLAGCAALDYCHATVNKLTWDADSNRLFVAYIAWVGAASNAVVSSWHLAGYNLATGTRSWVTALHGPPVAGEQGGWVESAVEEGGRVLLRGTFPLDEELSGDDVSRFLAVNPATGAITQRWNRLGEQALSDGSPLAAAGDCFTNQWSHGVLFPFDGATAQWVGTEAALCIYTVVAGSVVADTVPGVTAPGGSDAPLLPTTEYRAGNDDLYVVGPWMAVNATNGDRADWHPDPAARLDGAPEWLVVSSAGIVLGGDFQFVRGTPAPGVVALTSSLSPDPSFQSPLRMDLPPEVRALALHDGWLLVGGRVFLPSAPGTYDARAVLALEPATGAAVAWHAGEEMPAIVETIAVDDRNGEFWIGGPSRPLWEADSGTSLLRFEPPSSGADRLTAPALTCLTAPIVNGHFPAQPVCGLAGHDGTHVTALAFDAAGRLYIAGGFGAVDGTPRRGLARLDATGAVDAWAPDLLGVLPIPSGSGLYTLDASALAFQGGRVLVGGEFAWITPSSGGGGSITTVSPLLVFSGTSGALLRPTDPDRWPWFPVAGWWSAGYDIVARDSGVIVALGDTGVIVLNPVTLDYDSAASAPLVTLDWWGRNSNNGVFALATTPQTAANSTVSAADASRVVLAGTIPRWGFRVAGNMLATGIAATPPNMQPPTITTPALRVALGKPLTGSAVPVQLTWTAARNGGAVLDHYLVERSTNGGAWVRLSSTLAGTSFSTSVAPSGTVRFRVKAVNQNGAMSSWAPGLTLTPRLIQGSSTTVRYSGTWSTSSSTSYSGGSTRQTSAAGARATYTFTGRSVGLVTTKAPNRGKVKVYVNGVYLETIDLYASTSRHRLVAWQRAWSTSGTRTIAFVAVGTAGRPRVDIDAFISVK